ncbi:hypothetical protein [Jiella marina]|uniref:hypothetical protein n=1 Tax=Jiella sp. LLJ827 TaxID=2917712 RepID=UPI00210181A9|nr:hypothetical protein [Jiella sp. LLJ827]MCQ0986616.1 hypothetical protein [Jiella sp. LLJ827]
MTRQFVHTRETVYNRGRAPESFLDFIIDWAKQAPDALFEYNDNPDVYSWVRYKLGPWKEGSDFLRHRKAVMLEVLRTLCGFESSWDWEEGIDQSANDGKPYERDEDEWEAGILQASSNTLRQYAPCRIYAQSFGIGVEDHTKFREFSMKKGIFPIQYGAIILRQTYRHHGPLKRTENNTRNPLKSSIHPYLSVDAVDEFERFLQI